MTNHEELRKEAQAELARRELARRELRYFAQFYYPGWPVKARHLELLCSKLQQVERYIATKGREGIGRLMVFMPPRHWKSSTASVLFPAWVLGRNPDCRIIDASYNSSLATSFSRRTRNLLGESAFRVVFGEKSGSTEPVTVADDTRSAEEWSISGHMGGVLAAGVMGGISGRGAGLFIIDDPFKDRAEAESKIRRDAVDDWWKSAAYTRLEVGSAALLIMTRWSPDDLAGRLLKRMVGEPNADQWEVLSLPAIAEDWALGVDPAKQLEEMKKGIWMGVDPLGRQPGEALWPGEYGLEQLKSIQGNIGSYEFDALYQQRPQQRTGNLIKTEGIIRITPDKLPQRMRVVRYWDLAVSGSKRADWISGGKVGYAEGKIYILRVDRFRGPWINARADITRRMLSDDISIVQGVETDGQQAGYYQELKSDPKLLGRTIIPVLARRAGNKEVRAQVWGSRIPDGLVYLLDDGTWDATAFLDECAAFPNGAHDDSVDTVSGGNFMLSNGAGMRAATCTEG
jgi:predicted phage terminase large subunit-like protein